MHFTNWDKYIWQINIDTCQLWLSSVGEVNDQIVRCIFMKQKYVWLLFVQFTKGNPRNIVQRLPLQSQNCFHTAATRETFLRKTSSTFSFGSVAKLSELCQLEFCIRVRKRTACLARPELHWGCQCHCVLRLSGSQSLWADPARLQRHRFSYKLVVLCC